MNVANLKAFETLGLKYSKVELGIIFLDKFEIICIDFLNKKISFHESKKQ